MAFAIDFGTSNTVVSRWNAVSQTAEVVRLEALSQTLDPPVIPSLLYVEAAALGQTLAGQTVRDRGLDSAPQRCFRNFKRGIGTPVQGFMPELDGTTLSFEQVGDWFLTQVIKQLASQETALEEAIFTVPVDSFDTYRSWLGQLAQGWAIDRIRMVDEPTAAALGYQVDSDAPVLVVDFGGGTLDLAIVQLAQGRTRPLGFILKWGQKAMANSAQQASTAKVLAKAGEALGGADIDQWLAEQLCQQQSVELSPLMLRLAERLKIRLSAATQASESYFDDETFESYEFQLTRQGLEDLLQQQGFFERLETRLDQVLQQGRRQGVAPEDIGAVLLVGGTCQIPAVQAWVKQRFGAERVRCDRPLTAVSTGALQLQQVELQDFLYHGYGIRFWDRRQQRHGWHPIINRGQPYPTTEPVELVLGASNPNQPSIELVVGELGETQGGVEVFFEGNQLVTRAVQSQGQLAQPLNEKAPGIATLTPPGKPGEDRIQVQFTVDRQRLLRLTVADLLTDETLVDDQVVAQLT